jgi:chemotaxis protein methyltransferase CheR
MSAALAHGTFDTIANLLKVHSGQAIGQDKLYLLDTRLAPILKRHGLRDLNALAERLKVPRTEPLTQEVVEAMTTNESLCFRDDKPFEHVRTQALPRLHTARPPGAPIRIWSAASSSGQEAYSLAMILTDMRASLGDRRVEIVGTDIARDQLARAREGISRNSRCSAGCRCRCWSGISARRASGGGWPRRSGAWWISASGTCWPTCVLSGGSTWCSAAMC